MDPQHPLYIVNEFVTDWYKPFGLCTEDCWKHMFKLNNETMNNITSLLNVFLTFVWCTYVILIATKKTNNVKRDIFIGLVVLAGVCHAVTWTASLVAHTFSTHKSVKLIDKLWLFDMASIYLTIFAFCTILNFMEVSPYVSMVTMGIIIGLGVLLCIGAIVFFLTNEKINEEQYRYMRAVPWVAIVFLYFVPLFWKVFTYGASEWTPWYMVALVWYIIGGFFHQSKFPESLNPPKHFQLWCLSHHWWHWANIFADSCFFMAVAVYAHSNSI